MSNYGLPRLTVSYWIKDDKDNIISPKKTMKSKTWVGNIIRFIANLLASYTNTSSSAYIVQFNMQINSTLGQTDVPIFLGFNQINYYYGGAAPSSRPEGGIKIGSSNTSVTLDQYNLVSPYPSGSIFQYQDSTVSTNFTGSTWTISIQRGFKNVSNSNQTVAEFGLFIFLPTPTMFARDVPSQSVIVPPNATLVVQYNLIHSV